MAAAGFGKTAQKDGFGGFEKEDVRAVALLFEAGELLFDFAGFDVGADVDADGEVGHFAAPDVVGNQGGQHFYRQVVDAVAAGVFEEFEGDGFARAGEAANQDDLHGKAPALS